MDGNTDDVEVLSRERSSEADSVLIIEHAPFMVYELELTPAKLMWLWDSMSKSRTLFSDLTKGDFDNFLALVADKNSFWMEVRREDEPIGVIYIENLHRVTDCEAHINFFDGLKKINEKQELCRILVKWVFNKFHVQRISVAVPKIYFATIEFAKRVGFIAEGRRREVYRIGGRWVDEILMGVTRGDLDGWKH